MNLSSSRSLRRPWSSALCISREGFWRFGFLGIAKPASNSNISSRTVDYSPCTDSVINAGQLHNFSSKDNEKDAQLIMFGSIPILSATGLDVDANHCISKFASHSSSSWSVKNDSSTMSGFTKQDEFSLPAHFEQKRKFAPVKMPNFSQSYSTGAGANYNSYLSEYFPRAKGFDICLSASAPSPVTGHLGIISWSKRKHKHKASKIVLRPGMVLLRNHLTHEEQVEIVRSCRTLGVGPGGFYQPGYKDGAKLDMQMMCLGLNWDPERLTYEFIRSVDGCEVPFIPHHFIFKVRQAMAEAYLFIEKKFNITNAEDILPPTLVNVCIVNFYSATTGRLGLHQDCSDRRRSLTERLPVISFSMGDSAEFLYGDERDESMAKKVILKSGDVLIFGGESRHIYHGISSIIPNTAPKRLLEETSLRPGRLNLTFREA